MGLKQQISTDATSSVITPSASSSDAQTLFRLKINEYLIPNHITMSRQTHNDNHDLILHTAAKIFNCTNKNKNVLSSIMRCMCRAE